MNHTQIAMTPCTDECCVDSHIHPTVTRQIINHFLIGHHILRLTYIPTHRLASWFNKAWTTCNSPLLFCRDETFAPSLQEGTNRVKFPNSGILNQYYLKISYTEVLVDTYQLLCCNVPFFAAVFCGLCTSMLFRTNVAVTGVTAVCCSWWLCSWYSPPPWWCVAWCRFFLLAVVVPPVFIKVGGMVIYVPGSVMCDVCASCNAFALGSFVVLLYSHYGCPVDTSLGSWPYCVLLNVSIDCTAIVQCKFVGLSLRSYLYSLYSLLYDVWHTVYL